MLTAPKTQCAIELPASVKRFVVLGGCNGFQVEVAASLHQSPFFFQDRHTIAILSNAPTTVDLHQEVHTLSRIVADVDESNPIPSKLLSNFSVVVPRSNEKILQGVSTASPLPLLRTASPYSPASTASDVFVYVSNASAVFGPEDPNMVFLRGVVATAKTRGMLLVVSSEDVFPKLSATIKSMHGIAGWQVVWCRVPVLGPPSTPNYPRFHDDLPGPLENVCLGIALGVVRKMRVSASQPTGVVPVDVALNTGVLTLSLVHAHKLLPPSMLKQSFLEIPITSPSGLHLVWGMVGEYCVDYFGRYLRTVNQNLSVSFFERDPSIDFSVQFKDLWNYGIDFTAPMIIYRQYISQFHRNHLAQFPHSTTTERMQRILSQIDHVLDKIRSPPNRLKDMMAQTVAMVERSHQVSAASAGSSGTVELDGANYATLLRLVGSLGPAAAPALLQAVSVDWVQWEMYVKRICVAVLKFTSAKVLNLPDSVSFPAPTRIFHNDLVFEGSDRAPNSNLWLRRLFPDLHWALRCGQQPTGSLIGLRPGGTQQRRVSILAQPHIQLLISQLSREQNIPKDGIEQRAHSILRGIGDTLNHQQLRTFGIAIRKIFKTLYERINLNDEAYDRLFNAFRRPRCSVVILPTHRSYVDFLVISVLLTQMGFSPPHICAGEDFLRLGGIAELLRGSGAFFMRRSFRNDKLYGALFKEYVRHLVRDGECVEFFIEGMRSRTGKTLGPKLGFLKFITDAYFEKQDEVDDVLFVPVGLSYERLLEGNVYADELMGIPKPKETVGNLIKSASILRSNYGSLNVEVGEAISLKQFAADPHQCPPGFARVPEAERDALPKNVSASSLTGGGATYTPQRTLSALAWRITYDLQKNIVVTPTAVLAAVLQCLIDHAQLKTGVPVAAVASNVEWVRSAVLHRKGRMNRRFAVCDGEQLTSYAIPHLQPRLWISPLSHVFVDPSTAATTNMFLSIYSSQLLHVFADEAVVVIAAFAFGTARPSGGAEIDANSASGTISTTTVNDAAITVEDTEAAVRRLRRILSNEVPNFLSPCPISLDSWLTNSLQSLYDDNRSLRQLPLSEAKDEELVIARNQFTLFVSQLVYPLIESVYVVLVVAQALLQSTRTKLAESQFMKLAHEGALALHRAKLIHYAQCSSKENLKNSLDMILKEGVVTKETTPAATYSIAKGGASGALTLSALQQLQEKPQPGAAPAASVAATATPTAAAAAPQLPLTAMFSFVNCVRFRPSTPIQNDAAVGTILKMMENLTVQSGAKL